MSVYDPFSVPDEVRVEGAVEARFVFRYGDWEGKTRIVRSELRGSTTYVPVQDYLGVPLASVLEEARPQDDAATIRVVADDGYEAAFDWEAIRSNQDILLSLDDGRLRLVAPGYDGAYWVRGVTRLVVE